MDLLRTAVIWISLLACGTFMVGCSSKSPIRHLPSDISLAVPNQTTQKEVVSFMGFPDAKKIISQNEEEWIYYQANKSLLRRTPLLGDKMGATDYDVAIITFRDKIVTSSQYRSFTEEEFKHLGITNDAGR
jgi:hypothetical protein